MTSVVAVFNLKGGVGKTTIAFNLGHGLAREGKRVLAIDNDPQGNLTSAYLPRGVQRLALTSSYYGTTPDNPQAVGENQWLVSGDDSLEEPLYSERGPTAFARVIGEVAARNLFDLIVIDATPQISNLTFAGLMAATHVLIPITPDKFALEGVGKLLLKMKELRLTGASRAVLLGFVLNLVVDRTGLHQEGIRTLRDRSPNYLFESVLHRRIAFQEAPMENKSIFDYEPNGKAAYEMGLFVREFLKRLEGNGHG